MKKDINEGKHAGSKPEAFRATRPDVFGLMLLRIFHDHICQEIKLRRFHNVHGKAADKGISS